MTTRLQSDFLPVDHVVPQFGQGLFQDLTQAVVGTAPFALVAAGIWCLVVFCLRYKRARKNVVTSQSPFAARFRYHLADSGFRYLIPIGIGTTFYVLLSCYIYFFLDSRHYHSLISMQKFFKRVSDSFDHYFKLPEYAVLAVLVAIYLLSCALLSTQLPENNEGDVTAGAGDRSRFRERLVAMLYRVVQFYSKYTGPMALLLATLASFTLFGMQLGAPAKDLQLRLNHGQLGYSDVTKKAEAELSEGVIAELYTKIRADFPSPYQDALMHMALIDSEVKSVQQYADDAKSRYGVSDPVVTRTLQDEQAKISDINQLRSDLLIKNTGRQSVPGNATINQIDNASKALDSHHEGKGIALILDGQKKITLESMNLAGEQIRMLTKPLTESVPILDPVIQVLVDAVTKASQEPIGKSYDRVIQTAMQNPQDLEIVVASEAKGIADKTDVHTLVARATPRALQQSEELNKRLSSLQEDKLRIDRDVAGIPPLPAPHLPPPGSPARITPPGPLDPPKEAYPERGNGPLDHLLTCSDDSCKKVSESKIMKLLRKLPKSRLPR